MSLLAEGGTTGSSGSINMALLAEGETMARPVL
jgi:hypothetical protein